MNYAEIYNEEKKLILVRISGELTKEALAPRALETRLRAKELGYRIVFNCLKAKYLLTPVDAFYWFSDYYDHIDPTLKFIPTAYVSCAKDLHAFKFLETTFQNKGANNCIFRTEEEAIDWLESLKSYCPDAEFVKAWNRHRNNRREDIAV